MIIDTKSTAAIGKHDCYTLQADVYTRRRTMDNVINKLRITQLRVLCLIAIYTWCLRVHAHAASKDKGRERYHYCATAYKQ